MISRFFRSYWSICLLKGSPKNTPYSITLAFLSGLLLTLIKVFEWNSSYLTASDDLGYSLFNGACLTFSYVIYTYVVLFFRGFKERLVQTVTVLFCAHIIMHVLIVPLLFIAPYLSQINLKHPLLLCIGVFYLFFSMGLTVWQFVITAHIYKHALSTTPIQSVLIAFGLIAVNILTISSLK